MDFLIKNLSTPYSQTKYQSSLSIFNPIVMYLRQCCWIIMNAMVLKYFNTGINLRFPDTCGQIRIIKSISALLIFCYLSCIEKIHDGVELTISTYIGIIPNCEERILIWRERVEAAENDTRRRDLLPATRFSFDEGRKYGGTKKKHY
jgi:hypothetical protein